jgi:hypothetical protein
MDDVWSVGKPASARAPVSCFWRGPAFQLRLRQGRAHIATVEETAGLEVVVEVVSREDSVHLGFPEHNG